MGAVDPEFVMQVWSGGQATHAHPGNGLALAHALAHADAALEAVQVRIEGGELLAVADNHHVAVATLAPGEDYLAVAGGINRRAGGCGIVDALVGAHRVEDRVLAAQAEAGADTAEGHRRADEFAAHGVAFAVQVFHVAVLALEAEGGEVAIPVPEFRHQDVAIAHLPAVQVKLLVEHAETVALADIQHKIHVPAENIGQLHGQVVGHARLLAGQEQ